MPIPPRPIVVEVVEEPDPDIACEAHIAVIQLLIDFILEDRVAAESPAKLDTRAIA